MTQEVIPAGKATDPPDLPPPPRYWAMTTSSYSSRRTTGREHCTVCVLMIHEGEWKNGVPRPAHWIRRKAKGDRIADALLLCHFHRRQYLNRDNEARAQAKLAPLPGGG